MTRASEIQTEIKRLQGELEGLARMDTMGVREFARAAGISPTTAMRVKRGATLSKGIMQKVLPFMSECPCCGQKLTRKPNGQL